MVELTTLNLLSHKINDTKNIVQNFKTLFQSQVELHSYKVENLVANIRPPFANLITYYVCHHTITRYVTMCVIVSHAMILCVQVTVSHVMSPCVLLCHML